MKISILVIALSFVGFGGSLAIAAAPVKIEVQKGTPKVLVNGKEYVPGTAIPKKAKIQIVGAGEVKIGGAVLKTTEGGEFKLNGTKIVVLSGSADVTNGGQTTTLVAGDTASIKETQTSTASNPPAPGASATPPMPQASSAPNEFEQDSSIPPPPPGPNPNQNQEVAPTDTVSPSAP